MEWCTLDLSGSGEGPVEGSYVCGDKPSGSKNAGKFLSGCTTGGLLSSAQLRGVS
jgi:hypothetical protein